MSFTRSIWRGPRNNASRRGFALVATLWTLGLIIVLATALISGARYRARNVSTALATTRATLAADNAIALGVALILSDPSATPSPIRCTMPDATDVFVAIDNEAGKVDLNTANRE